MQNRDHSRSLPLPSIVGLHRPMPAGFRVMARCRNEVKCLVSLTAYREDAVELAERFRDVAIARTETPARGKKQERDGLAAIVVEEWDGTLIPVDVGITNRLH